MKEDESQLAIGNEYRRLLYGVSDNGYDSLFYLVAYLVLCATSAEEVLANDTLFLKYASTCSIVRKIFVQSHCS